MDTESPRSGHRAGAVLTNPGGRVNRRRLLAGSLVTGVVAAGAARIAGAQDDPATPDATPNATPEGDTGNTGVAETDRAQAEEAIARADAVISSVRVDRDSIASSIDVSDIDSILGQTDTHRNRAGAALASGSGAPVREAMVASATAWTARLLLEARLAYPGLPSQDVRTSQELVRAHENIAAVSADAAAETDANVSFFITNAQQLYASAFDLYNGGAFAQAAGTAQAAASLARIATFLTMDATMTGRGRPHRGGMDDGRMGPLGGKRDSIWPGTDRWDDMVNDPFDAEDQEPVTVPEPDF